MTLPGLELQVVYSRLAWGVVLAAFLMAALARRRTDGRAAAWLAAASLAAMWLPGAASPAYWLGLAFQSPSALWLALCGAGLVRQWRDRGGASPWPNLLPMPLAMLLSVGGLVLYADATGWLGIGLYARGFDPVMGPVAGLAIGLFALACLWRGERRTPGLVLLAAVGLYAVLRLPTGNVFDALIDPLLWFWACLTVLRRSARRTPPLAAG